MSAIACYDGCSCYKCVAAMRAHIATLAAKNEDLEHQNGILTADLAMASEKLDTQEECIQELERQLREADVHIRDASAILKAQGLEVADSGDDRWLANGIWNMVGQLAARDREVEGLRETVAGLVQTWDECDGDEEPMSRAIEAARDEKSELVKRRYVKDGECIHCGEQVGVPHHSDCATLVPELTTEFCETCQGVGSVDEPIGRQGEVVHRRRCPDCSARGGEGE